MNWVYAGGALRSQPLRTALSVGGIALCAVLMLFLLGVYRGVAGGSLEYIHRNAVDLWVLQRNNTNIMRCTSVLFAPSERRLAGVSGVAAVAPVLLILATVDCGSRTATVYLAGYDPMAGAGGPPRLVSGREPREIDEVVLDAAFAGKYGYRLGDGVSLNGRALRVVGTSGGTNAFVIQYAFVTLDCARRLVGVPGLATCYLVRVDPDTDASIVARHIRDGDSSVAVFTHAVFVENNRREMQAGFLPFIYTVAGLGVVVLSVILSLLLSIHILERRRELAVMKALGAPRFFLAGTVCQQSLILAGAGAGLALLLFGPLTALIARLSPEVAVSRGASSSLIVVAVVLLVGLVSAGLALPRLRRIYALEAFS